jgi:sigma-B regulation protein RsbU (phosphoserine phosphatase)
VHGRVDAVADTESYIVAVMDGEGEPFVPGTSAGAPVVRVIGSSAYQDTGMAWDTTPEIPQLLSGETPEIAQTISDLIVGRDGVRRMPHNGRESLWVYGRLQQVSSALLYIVPVDEIESIAEQAQTAVSYAVFEQERLAGIALATLIAVVAVLAMLAARSVTSPLRALAMTARGLAEGNLESRASVKSSDEVGELANAFNAMIPQLRSHISVMESLTLAREVQQKLLPASAPTLPGFEFAGRCVYSEDVGGDYYDFVCFDESLHTQRVGVVVGDVAGHGVVAALTMTSVRALLRSHADDGRNLCAAMNAVNSHLVADSAGGRFVTLVYLVIDPVEHSIRWVSAGHGPILIYDMESEEFEDLEVKDIPLGVNSDWAYQECVRTRWPSSGLLIMGTDGIWETSNPEGQVFGRAGLMEVTRAVAHLSAGEICSNIVETLHHFAEGEPQRDDVTLVVVKFLPPERSA